MEESMNTQYWFYVRIFHVLLGLSLVLLSYFYINHKPVPVEFYYVLGLLGLGAVVYHGYKLGLTFL